jgi:hypothetical protein
MPISTAPSAGYPRGLGDLFRDLTVEMLLADDIVHAFVGERVDGATTIGEIPGVGIPYVAVAIGSVDPKRRIGGIDESISVTSTYVMDAARRIVSPGEATYLGVYDHHVALVADNAMLPDADGISYVEEFDGFESVLASDILSPEGNEVRLTLSISATYKLRPRARAMFKTSQL